MRRKSRDRATPLAMLNRGGVHLSPVLLASALLVPMLLGAILAVLPLGAALRLAGGLFGVLFVMIAVFWPQAARPRYRWLLGGVGVSIALLFLWPKYAYIPLDALPTKNPQRMFFIAFLAYFLFALATASRLREQLVQRLKSTPVLTGLVLSFFVWRLVSSAAAGDPAGSAYASLIETFEFLTPFLLLIAIFRDRRDLDYLVLVLLATTAIICLLALAEGAVKKNLFEPLIAVDTSRLEFFREALVAKIRDQQYRVKASFHHPLLLAEFLVCMLPLLFYRIGRAGFWERVLHLSVLVMTLWAIHMAQSRSAIVAGVLAAFAFGCVYFARTFARGRLDARTALSVLAIPAFLLAAVVGYLQVVELTVGRSAAEQASSLARVEMLKYGIPLILDNLVLGHGVGFGPQILGYVGETGQITLDSYYLSLALDSGLPALALLLGIVGWAALRGLHGLRAADPGEGYLCAALSISAVAFALVKTILATEHNFPLFFILIGALVVLKSPMPRERETGPAAPPRAAARASF